MLKITLNLKENTKFFSLEDLKRRASGFMAPYQISSVLMVVNELPQRR